MFRLIRQFKCLILSSNPQVRSTGLSLCAQRRAIFPLGREKADLEKLLSHTC